MKKNLFLLLLLTGVATSYAKDKIAKESLTEAESYRLEKASPVQEAKRSLAGSKLKKKKGISDVQKDAPATTESPDSEVRYWQYSE